VAGIVEIGSALLSRTQAEAEIAAQNVVNLTTPGYKARRHFAEALHASGPQGAAEPSSAPSVDFTPGKIRITGNPFDLAIVGEGFFVVRSQDRVMFTRDGQFVRDAEGRWVTPHGLILQSDAGDVTTSAGEIAVAADGTVLRDGEPVARIGIARFADPAVLRPVGGSLFEAPTEIDWRLSTPHLEQGALEASNVSNAVEMLALMASLRRAETGQKLIQTYDDLMGKALAAFGQA
jgi:flagellar basal-body rod protein FlgF